MSSHFSPIAAMLPYILAVILLAILLRPVRRRMKLPWSPARKARASNGKPQQGRFKALKSCQLRSSSKESLPLYQPCKDLVPAAKPTEQKCTPVLAKMPSEPFRREGPNMSMLSPVFSAPFMPQMLRDKVPSKALRPVPPANGAPLKPLRCCAETKREEPRNLLRAMYKHHFYMETDISHEDRSLASTEEGLPLTEHREGSLATAASMMLPADLELFFSPSDSLADESSARGSPAAQPGTPVKDHLKTADVPCEELGQSTVCIAGAWGIDEKGRSCSLGPRKYSLLSNTSLEQRLDSLLRCSVDTLMRGTSVELRRAALAAECCNPKAAANPAGLATAHSNPFDLEPQLMLLL